MATAFMRWLETRPGDYDRGIRILTLGRLDSLQQRLVDHKIRPGWKVLEIGCGTGALTVKVADAGADVTAIDRSNVMLAEAEMRVSAQEHEDRVTLLHMDATAVADQFKPGSFDAVVSSLAFSEMNVQEQNFVLIESRRLLKPGGTLLILDEFEPGALLMRCFVRLIRLPLRVLTWLLTRTTTTPLIQFNQILLNSGFVPGDQFQALGGALKFIQASPEGDLEPFEHALPSLGRLHGPWTWKMALMEMWALFFRILPPYPQQEPGLYEIGEPGMGSPVLVTGNYLLTVQRLLRAVDGRTDAWLLVTNSEGVNVWCGAGGGFMTAERVLAAWRLSRLNEQLNHRTLILPELCANGVDGWKIRAESGWEVKWGPVRAKDIPGYLQAGMSKTDEMRLVSFPLLDRLEMMAGTLGFYALMILLPVAIFWKSLLTPLAISLFALSTFYAVALPLLPGRDGLEKSVPLAVIALLGMLTFSLIEGPASAEQLFNRAVGICALSVFVSAELQGMSPQMRGEQANWGWEAVIALALLLIYWVVPMLAGWR